MIFLRLLSLLFSKGLHRLNRRLLNCQLLKSSLSLCLLCTILFPAIIHAADNPLQSVFVLHSYHRGYKWTDDENAGIEEALRGMVNQDLIYIEYMDAGRVTHQRDYTELYQEYKRKYRDLKFDVICVTDAEALDFMLRYRDRLFPHTPLVFSGATAIDKTYLSRVKGLTGVSAEPDLKANIDLIRHLHPETKQIVFINEWTTKGRLLHDEFIKVMPFFESSLDFRLMENVDVKDIFRLLGAISKESVILYGIFGRDKVGRAFEHKEIVELLSRNSTAPMYSPWDLNLGDGVVGGVMVTGYSQGHAAGQQMLQLLRGARVENMPMIMNSAREYKFDYHQLQRFGIHMIQLPPGSAIVNFPETFFVKYRKYVIVTAAVIGVLLVVISALLLNIRFRKRTERELTTSRERLQALAWQFAEVEDKERKGLSRELHDQVGQNLTLLGVNLNLLRSLIVHGPIDVVQSKISDSLTIVKQTTQRIRNVMGNLRSPVLDDYGLVAAMQLYGKRCADQTGLHVKVRGSNTIPRLDPQCENALFRIVQEAVTNVVKHAHATEVNLTVRHFGSRIRLSIEDNGVGFDEVQLRSREDGHGWGMATMRERALAVGATFRVRSSPGQGTHVFVELSLS
jgi:signal transduction histidine kinase